MGQTRFKILFLIFENRWPGQIWKKKNVFLFAGKSLGLALNVMGLD